MLVFVEIVATFKCNENIQSVVKYPLPNTLTISMTYLIVIATRGN